MHRWLVIGFRLVGLITLGVITWLALATAPPMPALFRIWDKADHFSAFFVLAFLLDYSFPRRHWSDILKWASLLGYGIGIEYMQRWLGTRDFDVHDMFADAIGISAYLLMRPLVSRLPLLRLLRSTPEN